MILERSDLELEVLYNRIDRQEIDLQPEYQRGEVWDRARQQRLIDTVLRNWYIPAIHIVKDDNLNREFVLDGQQRLRTIQLFFQDKLRVSGSIEPLRADIADYNNQKFSQLPVSVQMRVRRFRITVVTLSDYNPEEPSELFFRLNQQYALTPPEKRNALFGKARDAVREVVTNLQDAAALRKETVGFSNDRLAYDDVVSRFCVALSNGTLDQQIRNIDVEHFYRRATFSPEILNRALAAGLSLGETLNQIGGTRFNKATLFTWLVVSDFFEKQNQSPIPPGFLQEFELIRAGHLGLGNPIASDRRLPALINIYTSRASYRVLDVTSVLLRDMVVHALHALMNQPIDKEALLLRHIDEAGGNLDEGTLLSFASRSGWGDL